MKIFINSYKKGSKSVKALKEGLIKAGIDAKIIKKVGSNYVDKPDHLVINWGDSGCVFYGNMVNNRNAVSLAANKLYTFRDLELNNVRTVPYLKNMQEATDFLSAKEGRTVYCRTLVNASQGDGIVVAKTPDQLVPAPLYTGGLSDPKRKEFRVHVFDGEVILTQQKRRCNGYKENPDYSEEVRNLNGGWVFTKKDVEISEDTKDTCVAAVEALGLTFGAVDILESSNGLGWVLEVNTACGLEGTTVDVYVENIKNYMEKYYE